MKRPKVYVVGFRVEYRKFGKEEIFLAVSKIRNTGKIVYVDTVRLRPGEVLNITGDEDPKV